MSGPYRTGRASTPGAWTRSRPPAGCPEAERRARPLGRRAPRPRGPTDEPVVRTRRRRRRRSRTATRSAVRRTRRLCRARPRRAPASFEEPRYVLFFSGLRFQRDPESFGDQCRLLSNRGYPGVPAALDARNASVYRSASRPTVSPLGRSRTFSSASSTPGTNAARENVSWRIVSVSPSPPKITSW